MGNVNLQPIAIPPGSGRILKRIGVTHKLTRSQNGGGYYNTHGHKLRFPPSEKAQFVTECGISL